MKTFDQLFSSVFGSKPAISQKAQDDCLLRGRITRPPIPLTDPAFQYTPACATNAESIRKAAQKQ